MLAAAILAAGESRRMGTPKALIPYRGSTFLEHLVEVTRHPRVGIIRVVLGAGAENIRTQLKLSGDLVIINDNWRQGQLSSIQTAVRSIMKDETDGIIVCPVDHPLVSKDLVAQIIAAFDAGGKDIALPTFQGKRGHPVIFRADLYDELLAASPSIGARQVVWEHKDSILEIPTDEEGVVLNLNDPETLRRASVTP
jgi:molybdenum cofactor cytidylyltransferase